MRLATIKLKGQELKTKFPKKHELSFALHYAQQKYGDHVVDKLFIKDELYNDNILSSLTIGKKMGRGFGFRAQYNYHFHKSIYLSTSLNTFFYKPQYVNYNFTDINDSIKKFGYSPNFNVWVKFTIHNSENEPISKILEFDNSLVTNIVLYENELLINKEGLINKKIDRKTVNPTFLINLDKNETKTYYMEIYSKKTSLTLKLNLYSYDDFYSKEILHQIIFSHYNFLIFFPLK